MGCCSAFVSSFLPILNFHETPFRRRLSDGSARPNIHNFEIPKRKRRPIPAIITKAVLLSPLTKIVCDLTRPIASGSFGEVFFGNLPNGDSVVLKRARDTPVARRLFARERQINQRISTFETCDEYCRWPLYLGTYTRYSQTFLVWRRVGNGDTLEHYLSRCSRTMLEDALGISSPAGSQVRLQLFRVMVEELLRAADELHRRGIIHGDLKPENVLIVPSGRRCRVQIIDFGASLDTKSLLWKRTSITALDPLYAAPETRVSVFAPDRFDVFSIGMISLRVLFPDISEADLKTFRGTKYDCNLLAWAEQTGVYRYSEAEATSKYFDLLNRMLTKSPIYRITARQALEML